MLKKLLKAMKTVPCTSIEQLSIVKYLNKKHLKVILG
jgi:hypothetical protein